MSGRSRWSTRSTRTESRVRRPQRSRSARTWAGRPTTWPYPSATRATSPPTGRASPNTATPAWSRRGRCCSVSRPPARRRWCNGAPVDNPQTIATAIKIGRPASGDRALARARRVEGRDRGRDGRRDPRRLPRPRALRGHLLRAGIGSVDGRSAQDGTCRPTGPRCDDRVRANWPWAEGSRHGAPADDSTSSRGAERDRAARGSRLVDGEAETPRRAR